MSIPRLLMTKHKSQGVSMSSQRRSKKGGRRRRRPTRLPTAVAEVVSRRFNKREGKEGEGTQGATVPSSFVIRRGRLTPAARQLVRDMRRVMMPHCGERLRERRSSKLKDYLAAASLLGVTHLQLFTQTDAGLYFKLVQLPAGPTLSFRVLHFSLIHDVQRYYQQQKRKLPRAPDARDFLHPPLLIVSPQAATAANKVMKRHEGATGEATAAANKRGTGEDVETLVARVVKSAFPPIDIRTVELRDCRRVVLFRRESSVASGAPSSTSSSRRLHFQVRQYAVVRRIQDSTEIVTPGVRALVEAGSSRVAADRMLQQRFGISLRSDNATSTVRAETSLDTKGSELRSSAGEGRSPVEATSAVGGLRGERETAAVEAAGDRREAERKRKQQSREQRRHEREAHVKPGDDGHQDCVDVIKGKQQHRAWRDICEATLAREDTTAAADTDDEQCLSFDVSEVKTGAAVGSVPGKASGRRTKDGLLLLSVAAAAQQREKKEGTRGGAAGSAATQDSRTMEAAMMLGNEQEEGEEVAADAEREEEADFHRPKEDKLKMKVSLVELGPRMHLELVKVEEDVCAGAVLYHNFVKKTSEELSALQERDAALRQQREKEREAVKQALEKEFQKCKKWKDAADGACDNGVDNASSDDQAADTESCDGEKRKKSESVVEDGTLPQRDGNEGVDGATSSDLPLGESSTGRKEDHVSCKLLPTKKREANKSQGTASKRHFRSERVDAFGCDAGAAGDDQGCDNNRSKVSVKRKSNNILNAENKAPRRDASAVLRRYEAATARQRKDL